MLLGTSGDRKIDVFLVACRENNLIQDSSGTILMTSETKEFFTPAQISL